MEFQHLLALLMALMGVSYFVDLRHEKTVIDRTFSVGTGVLLFALAAVFYIGK